MSTYAFIRVTHQGVYADGRLNNQSILINDLDTGQDSINRKSPVYIPAGGFIDIPVTSRSLFSTSRGTLSKLIEVGMVITQFFLVDAESLGFLPTTSGPVENNNLFVDQATGGVAFKDGGGVVRPLGSGSGTTFVLRPGGVAGGNVHTTWASVYAAFQSGGGGLIEVIVDDSIAVAVVPAGAYDMQDVVLRGAAIENAGTPPLLTIADGVTFTNLRIISDLAIAFTGSAPAFTVSADDVLRLYNVTVTCSGTSPAVLVTGAGVDLILLIIGGVLLAPSGGAPGTFRSESSGDFIVQFGAADTVPYLQSGFFSDDGAGRLDFYPQGSAHAVSYVHANFTGPITETGLVPYANISGFLAEDVTLGLKSELQEVDSSGGGPYTYQLQNPTGVPDGYEVVVKDSGNNAGANNIVVSTAAGSIDGNPTATLSTNNGALRFRSNGTLWQITGQVG